LRPFPIVMRRSNLASPWTLRLTLHASRHAPRRGLAPRASRLAPRASRLEPRLAPQELDLSPALQRRFARDQRRGGSVAVRGPPAESKADASSESPSGRVFCPAGCPRRAPWRQRPR
jgi:hypothetical protein